MEDDLEESPMTSPNDLASKSGDESDSDSTQNMTPNDLASESDDEFDRNSTQVMASGNSTDGLPPGWTVERKTKIYKVYTTPTGMKFYSRKKVEAYLQNPTPRQPPNKRRKVTNTDREETNVGGLPLGWFQDIRYRETRIGTRKRVALYVDPMSGYAFFSTKDAQRYIDSGTIEDCRVMPRRWSEITKDTPGNKYHSQPTDEETELKPEGRRRSHLSTEEHCEEESKESITESENSDEDNELESREYNEGEHEKYITKSDNSDEDNESKSKERIETEPSFSEGNCEKKSEDAIETDDVPIEETAGTEEKEKEKMLERSPLKIRIKLPARRASTSSNPLTSNPSSACRMQCNLKSNGKRKPPESKQKQVASSLLDESSLGSWVDGLGNLVLHKNKEI